MIKLNRIVLFAIMIFACAGYTAAQPCTRHVETPGGFSICLPDGWIVKQQEGEAYKMLFGQPSDGFAPNLNFKEEKSNLELSAYVAAGVKNILASKDQLGTTSMEVLGQSDFVTDDGVRRIRIVLLSAYKGHQVRTIQYLFAASPGRKLIVTGTSLEKNRKSLIGSLTGRPNHFRSAKAIQTIWSSR